MYTYSTFDNKVAFNSIPIVPFAEFKRKRQLMFDYFSFGWALIPEGLTQHSSPSPHSPTLTTLRCTMQPILKPPSCLCFTDQRSCQIPDPGLPPPRCPHTHTHTDTQQSSWNCSDWRGPLEKEGSQGAGAIQLSNREKD